MNLSGSPWWRWLLLAGMTAVLVGYFAVWLPGPSAGLRLIGLELGEWIKFLGVGPSRDLFYAPPILLGLIMALLSTGWENGRWQTWAFRALAVLVSLLAFPAVAAITSEPSSEWLARLIGIGLVVVTALVASVLPGSAAVVSWIWAAIAVLSGLGIILPLGQYLTVLPVVSDILRQSVGLGLGLWLNCLGFLVILLVALGMLWANKKGQPSAPIGSQTT